MVDNLARNEEAIFDAAIRIKDHAERDVYVAEICGDNEQLLTSVQTLLRYHDSGSFLDAPAMESELPLSELPLTEGPGTIIGRYKLLERLGEGGMAVVYMAEQEHPIRRKVALKIIKLGMDTPQVIARFEAERQALAMMDHPNVAKVFDAGATETGRPYFVMELVTGVSITEYCDKNELNMRERLALFIQVCNAVQHAHQKGIIHRDLKPSNVMVTHRDGTPVPKIIDFGIAKAINQRLTEKTLFTRYAHVIGTPAYMSPEQAELSDLDIDTRSDIYSLGVLLYELLTGTPPFSEDELHKAGYLEMQRIIREEEPTKPSTKLSTLGETLTEIAKHRASTPDLLRRAIRGDLDWIVMKSLEKDRVRRYETASALAMEIERHLNSKPVQAGPPTTSYKLRRFIRRHRVGVLGCSLVLAALVIGFVVATYGLVEARRGHRESNIQRVRAERLLSEGLVFAGDSLVNASRFSQARESYTDAWEIADQLEISEIPATSGLLASYVAGPPPLLGTDGKEGGVGGFTGHTAVIRSVALSPDGRTAMSASCDNTLKLWDITTGLEVRTFKGHTDLVGAVIFSPNGKSVLSGSADRTLRLWNVETAKEICTFEGHSGPVNAVTFSPDGRTCASGSDNGEVKLWDVSTGKEIRGLAASGNRIFCVAFSPDGQSVIFGGWVWALQLWDVNTGHQIRRFVGHSNPVTSVTFCPHGRWVLTGSDDHTMKLWDAATGKVIRTFSGHIGGVRDVAFLPNERMVLSASSDKTLKLWDTITGELIGTFTGHKSWVESVAVSPDGRLALTAGADSTLKLWQLQRSREITAFSDHSGWVFCVAISPDDRTALSGGSDCTMRLWDIATGMETRKFSGHSNKVNAVDFSPDGRTAITASSDRLLKLWDLSTGDEIRTFSNHACDVLCAAFSHDGRTVLSGSAGPNREGRLKLWNVDTGDEIRTFEGYNEVRKVVFSHDDRTALSTSEDGTMKLWDVATGKLTRTFPCNGPLYGLAISPDHHTAMVGDYEGTLTLWNLVTGVVVHTLTGQGQLIEDVAFMPGGRTAVSAGRDWTVRLWDVESGIEVRSFAEHKHRVHDVAISKDGRWLLSASADGTVRVWDFLRPWHYREYESLLRKARRILAGKPTHPSALAAFGRWYAFRHVDDWAIDFLERARHAGADVSNLALARCYWRAGRLPEAHSEFRHALKHKEAPDSYLELCMNALERQQIRPLLQDDTHVQRYCWRAHGEKSLDTMAKSGSRISSTRQMIAWWKFDEAQDEIILDSSGNMFHGKLVGDAHIISDSDRGNVLSLDGDGDYVDCGNAYAFDIIHNITVSGWIKVNAFNKGQQTVVSKGDTAWRFQRDQVKGHLQFACMGVKRPDSSTFNAERGSLPGKKIVADRMWHHVAGVFDGEKIYVYVDGLLDNSTDVSGLVNKNRFPVLIGENGEKQGRYWDGLIDDVRIYNYALSKDEIEALFSETLGVNVTTPHPVNGASSVMKPVTKLSWNPGKGANAHNIYFGADPDSLELLGKVKETNFIQSPKLEKSRWYYWRVDQERPDGTTVKGNLWSFSTGQMISWWKFDQTDRGIALDSSGNGLGGKLIGDAHIISDSDRGNVLSLDGDGDYVDCGNNWIFDITDEITVAAWVKVNVFGREWQAIVTKGDSAWRLSRKASTDFLAFHCTGIESSSEESWMGLHLGVEGTVDVNDGKWHHVAGVYDGNEICLYVDGTLDNSERASGLIETNHCAVMIGQNAEKVGRCWIGMIDDVRIYSHALSEAEVKELYAGRGPGPNEGPQ